MYILSRLDPNLEDLVVTSYIYKSHVKSYVGQGGVQRTIFCTLWF
jgi:hypothetical protein